MSLRMRVFLVLWSLLLATAAFAGEPAGMFSDEVDTDLYDCTVELQPAANLAANAAVVLSLEWGAAKAYTRVTLTKEQLLVDAVQNRTTTPAARVAPGVTPGKPYVLTLMRRGNWLGIAHDTTLLFRGVVPRARGNMAGIVAKRGWTVLDTRIQRLEPVVFADNFMRTADESGGWITQSGTWGLQSAWDADPKGNASKFDNIIYSQNPFAWRGSNPTGPALCTVGKPFWEDYTLSASMQPAAGGAIGLAVNLTDAKNGLLIRWSPANDQSATGNRLSLFTMTGGKLTLVKEDTGGYIPGQWYKMSVVSGLDGVRVLIDRRERIAVKNVSPWHGGIGLYAEGALSAVFDDVTCYGRTLKTDLLEETQQLRINQRFRDDHNGMQEWSVSANDWKPMPGVPNQYVQRWDFFGDQWMTLTLRPGNMKTGQVWMALNADGRDPQSGYRAVLQLTNEPAKLTYTIYRDGTALATKTGKPLATGVEYSLRFWHAGKSLWLELDGEKILEATNVSPLAGKKPSYRATGGFSDVRDVLVMGRNSLQYTFSDAPVDWQEMGTWMQTVRWACAPQWSFHSGWSRGEAVLWYKNRLMGDQSFEAFVGPKMEYPRERAIYDNRYRDFGITICGDGHNPRSGYTGIFLEPDAEGNRRTVLLRNGVEVAGVAVPLPPNRGVAHREWFDLVMHKRGSVVELWTEGSLALSYTDPKPLEGGVPAVWTKDNGIAVALARLHFANPPEPRTDAQVIIDEPWYPEWGNVGQTITLPFPQSYSTTGKPIQLQATMAETPAGEQPQLSVTPAQVAFTPKTVGEYWSRITATDGANTSPAFHLALPVFNPAVARDDSHAVVLYRFDEGTGKTVHDQSAVKPAADLNIPADANAHWQPGQGLTLRGTAPLLTSSAVAKLMAIAKAKACTIEAWISTDTIYGPTGWSSCLVAWENTLDDRNFAVGSNSANLLVAPRGAQLTPNQPNTLTLWGFRTSLQHLVITWDGTTTRCYANGQLLGKNNIAWRPETWTPNNILLVGNQSDFNRVYLGSYYLLAIHDKCLSDADVQRHYTAGPSAK